MRDSHFNIIRSNIHDFASKREGAVQSQNNILRFLENIHILAFIHHALVNCSRFRAVDSFAKNNSIRYAFEEVFRFDSERKVA